MFSNCGPRCLVIYFYPSPPPFELLKAVMVFSQQGVGKQIIPVQNLTMPTVTETRKCSKKSRGKSEGQSRNENVSRN